MRHSLARCENRESLSVLTMKKDIKKSSYYVWFLGAEEARGLRGSEYMIPVIQRLVEREKETEPFKVTLQVSHKGIKIVQSVPVGFPAAKSAKGAGKNEVVKHFIPHHAVTSVYQDEDIVSCILLLFNPLTKCPVHVHAYRCDSIETAEILCGQLQTLLERPENQKKLEEIEGRLRAKGLVQAQRGAKKVHSPAPGSSDSRSSSARESDLSSGSDRLSGGGQESRIANLYDSLAAELKEKLCTSTQQNHAPILLPPRDYDTVHRQKGNLSGIDFRRCLNMNIVGINASKKKNAGEVIPHSSSKKPLAASPRTKVGSSGGSSGIGSDHAPSPDQENDNRFIENQSSSEEEWNAQPTDSLFLVQPTNGWHHKELSLPRARRHHSNGFDSPGHSTGSPSDPDPFRCEPQPKSPKKVDQQHAKDVRIPKRTFFDKVASKSEVKLDKRRPEERQRSPSPTEVTSPKERFKDAKEKFRLLERERLEQERLLQKSVEKKGGKLKKSWSKSRDDFEEIRYSEYADDEFEANEKRSPKINYNRNKSMESLNSEEFTSIASSNGYKNDLRSSRTKLNLHQDDERYQNHRMSRYHNEEERRYQKSNEPARARSYSEDYLPEQIDMKRYRDISKSQHSVPFAEEDSIPLQRYRSPTRQERRHQPPPTAYYDDNRRRPVKRSDSKYYGNGSEDKRRSMLDAIEDEKRRNSNEIAKEFKRRSYQEHRPGSELSYQGSLGYHEIEDHDRYPEKESRRFKNGKTPGPPAASPRYRHSYAEPFHHPTPINHEILQRTNSSLSSGRVGIAAVHHY